MSSYPDILQTNGAQGPSLSFLKVKYFEEHGFMPGPELDRQLLDQHWEDVALSQEATSTSYVRDAENEHEQQQKNDDAVEMSVYGHLKLIQRRLDLAPFFGASPTELHRSLPPAFCSGSAHGYMPAPTVLPTMPTLLAEPSFDLAAAVPRYGDPLIGGATPAHGFDEPLDTASPLSDFGTPVIHCAAPVAPHGDPFVEDLFADTAMQPVAQEAASIEENHAVDEEVEESTAEQNPAGDNHDDFIPPDDSVPPAQVATFVPPVQSAASIAPAQGAYIMAPPAPAPRLMRPKDPWTKREIDRVVYLRDKKNKSWAYIQKDLGTHTSGSIADKYWQLGRLAKGLKK